MRSQDVFKATNNIENRYLLCNVIRVATRKLHRAGMPMHSTITQTLVNLNGESYLPSSLGEQEQPIFMATAKGAVKTKPPLESLLQQAS